MTHVSYDELYNKCKCKHPDGSDCRFCEHKICLNCKDSCPDARQRISHFIGCQFAKCEECGEKKARCAGCDCRVCHNKDCPSCFVLLDMPRVK